MKQTCPRCQTVVEIDDAGHEVGDVVSQECPVCGEEMEFRFLYIEQPEPPVEEAEDIEEVEVEEVIDAPRRTRQKRRPAATQVEDADATDEDFMNTLRSVVNTEVLKKSASMLPDQTSSGIRQTTSSLQQSFSFPAAAQEEPVRKTEGQSRITPLQEIELDKFHWGAFVFGPLWGICNRVYWPLLMILVAFIPYVGSIAVFIMHICLGKSANADAWKAYQNDLSFDEFQQKQRRWKNAAWLYLLFWIALIVVMAASI